MLDSATQPPAEVTVGRPVSHRRQVLSAFRAHRIDPKKLIVPFRGLSRNIPPNPFRKSFRSTFRQSAFQPVQVRPPTMNSAALPAGNVHTQLPIMNRFAGAVDLTADTDDEDIEIIEDDHIINVNGPPSPRTPQSRPERLPWAQLPNEAIDSPRNQIFEALPLPPAQAGNNHFVNNLRDVDLARALQQQFDRAGPDLNPFDLDVNPAPIRYHDDPVVNPQVEPAQEQQLQIQTLEECQLTLLVLFPSICQDHVSDIYQKVSQNSNQLIDYILDRIEKGTPYPKSKKEDNNLKRKRDVSQDEAAALKYGAEDRPPPPAIGAMSVTIRSILSSEFPSVPMQFIDVTLSHNQHRLFHTYRHLDEVTREYNPNNPPFQKLKKPRPSRAHLPARVQGFLDSPTDIASNPDIAEAYRELQACRKHRAKAEAARAAEQQHLVEEIENERRAQADGTMCECGCCFGDFPINRMIHCNAETLHWFCKACARQTAETEIGNSKYEIHCMSMDGCTGGFANDQRSQFLDEKTIIALERNEQEAMLRMAGIENLASCPFCPFAAEYPPVEVDKEFRCQAPDCEKVSCRLCNLESHIPKSCEEFAKENGLSIRRQIEEAMSAAMIRKCNKCATPFIKEEGCNKMTCTRNGCRNIQCYVCSKSCGYNHFNDKSRGGKDGNCPLFESAEERHKQEVSKAEQEALAKVRADHPEYTEEDLKIKVSESVLKDEKQRKARDPAVMIANARANEIDARIVNYDIPLMAIGADIPHPMVDFALNDVFPEFLPGDQGWQDFPDPPARLPSPRYPRRPPDHNVVLPIEDFRPRQEYVPVRVAANPRALDRQVMKIEDRAARRFENAGLEPPGNLFGVNRQAANAVLPRAPPPPEEYFIHQPAHLLAPIKEDKDLLSKYVRDDLNPRQQIQYNPFIDPPGEAFRDDFDVYLQPPQGFVPINANDVKTNSRSAARPANANNKEPANALKKASPAPVAIRETPQQRIALLHADQRPMRQQGGVQNNLSRAEQRERLQAQDHMPAGVGRVFDPKYDDNMPNFGLDNFMPNLYEDWGGGFDEGDAARYYD